MYRKFVQDEVLDNGIIKGHMELIKTNADRIRSMTDEELAEYLDGVCHDLWQMFVADPQKMWLDWLKEEAKDNG